jgi:propanol-preferring alcohol dehydrogenase
MSSIPAFEYKLIYGERVIRSVANNTRDDGHEFLREAAMIPLRTSVETFELSKLNDALQALKNDAIKGAGVVMIS